MIEAVPVTNKRLLKAFIKTPWPIYRNDPAWVPPLLLERLLAFSPKEPIFEHLRWRAWVAFREGRPVGRISAQIDALHLQRYGDNTGFFGLIEGEDDPAVFAVLFAAAEGWLGDEGMKRVVGPLNLNINQEVGLLAEGYDSAPHFLMGHARPYYHPRIEALGYQPCQQMLAYELPPAAFAKIGAITGRRTKKLAKRFTLRPINRADKAAELELMSDIFNDAWAGNWGFVPFTKKEFKAVGTTLLLVIPHDLIWFAECNGEAVGFIAVFPNINEAIKDLNGRLFPWGWLKLLWRIKIKGLKTARAPLMGVRRHLHDSPLGGAIAMSLIGHAVQAGRAHGITAGELSWILEGNRGMRSMLERIGAHVAKRYRVYEKPLAAP